MNVICPECGSIFRVDPAKIPLGGVRARCSVCGGVIAIGDGAAFGGIGAAAMAGLGTGQSAPRAPMAPIPSMPPRYAGATTPVAPVAPRPPAFNMPALGTPRPAAEPANPWPAAPAPAPPAPPVFGGFTAPSAPAPVRPVAPPLPRPAAVPPQFTPPTAPPQAPVPAVPQAPPSRMPQAPPAGTPMRAPEAPRASTAVPRASTAVPGTRPPINPFLQADPDQKAKRLARALVSDIVAYFPEKHQEGLRNGSLRELFREEIKKSYEEYMDQVGKEFSDRTTHFQDALNDVLAQGAKVF